MKKKLIGAIVGGLLIFVWQSLSHTVLQLHSEQEGYTAKQDTIMNFLSSQLSAEGQYFMPNLPPGSSMDDMNKLGDSNKGKPWAMVTYHQAYNMDMTMALVRTFLVDFAAVLLLCWILFEMGTAGFFTIFLASLFTGLIVFLNSFYMAHIWYQTPGLTADMIDSLVSWGLCGIWLGWWLRRK